MLKTQIVVASAHATHMAPCRASALSASLEGRLAA